VKRGICRVDGEGKSADEERKGRRERTKKTNSGEGKKNKREKKVKRIHLRSRTLSKVISKKNMLLRSKRAHGETTYDREEEI